MAKGDDLKYGYRGGGKTSVPVKIAASQSASINDKGGKFVFIDAGQAKINIDGSTEILGFLEASGKVTYAENAELNCIVDPTARFVIPVNSGTFTADMIGKTCDLSVVSGVQGAQLDASAEDTVFIVDGDLVNNEWVEVMINTVKQRAVGVV